MCVSPTEETPSSSVLNSVLRSTGSSPIPSRDRFIGVRAIGTREERRSPEGFGITVGACAVADAGAGAGAEVGAGAGAAAGVGDDAYGVGWRERSGPRSGATACAGRGATGVDDWGRALGAARGATGIGRDSAGGVVCARVASATGGGSGGGGGTGGLKEPVFEVGFAVGSRGVHRSKTDGSCRSGEGELGHGRNCGCD